MFIMLIKGFVYFTKKLYCLIVFCCLSIPFILIFITFESRKLNLEFELIIKKFVFRKFNKHILLLYKYKMIDKSILNVRYRKKNVLIY